MLRHRIGDHVVGCGREDKPPAQPLLFVQPGDQPGIVGQQGRIEPGMQRQLLLQMRLSLEQPPEQGEHHPPVLDDGEEAFDQAVGVEQGAVHIDAQRHLAACCLGIGHRMFGHGSNAIGMRTFGAVHCIHADHNAQDPSVMEEDL